MPKTYPEVPKQQHGAKILNPFEIQRINLAHVELVSAWDPHK